MSPPFLWALTGRMVQPTCYAYLLFCGGAAEKRLSEGFREKRLHQEGKHGVRHQAGGGYR